MSDLPRDDEDFFREIIATHVPGRRPGWCAASKCGRRPCFERAAAIGALIEAGKEWRPESEIVKSVSS